MGDFGWNTFEVAATLCEQSIIFYFICNFLKHDFKSFKGRMVYVFGTVVGTVLVTILNEFTLYDWWLSAIYISYWFGFSFLFLNGKTLNKLFAAIVSDVVVISASNLISGAFSVVFKSSVDQIYTQHTLYRILYVLLVQIVNLYLFSLILKFARVCSH